MEQFGGAFSITKFCRAHSLSKAQYFKLRKDGRGPREMLNGTRGKLISSEAAADWRREREAEASKERAPKRPTEEQPEAT
jgi:hypothetical protein